MQLDFGETEYILISGLRFGPYVDLLHDERGQSNSNLRARLFPDITDSRLRPKDLEEYIMSPNYLALQDKDTVNPESTKVHNYTVAGFMLPFKILILEMYPEARQYYVCML
ncbi:unnamed protein product [Lactuca saligna]|uniref:Uncharacterized protein n=1 Tax=Lactuca saligna TaxID=75948 RepID=A0AA35YE55_LACSI|nr:unnamed protein product [Lactuca saligna]